MSLSAPTAAVPGEGPPLCYGSLVTLYDRTVDGYVVPSVASEAPVAVQRDGATLAMEAAVFELQPAVGGPTGDHEATAGGAGAHMGDVVHFGQAVRLVHRLRRQCLSHHSEQHAVGVKRNLRVLWTSEPADPRIATRWRLLPRYRMRAEGEAVVDGDAVVVMSVDDCHVLNRADRYTGETSHDHAFLEVSGGVERQAFEMRLYDGEWDPKSTAPHFGDVISLMHTETSMLVHSHTRARRCVLQTPHSATLDTPLPWCGVEGLHDRELGADLKAAAARQVYRRALVTPTVASLFVIEALDPHKGGRVLFGAKGSCCRLKSLATGQYLQTGTEALREDVVDVHAPASLAPRLTIASTVMPRSAEASSAALAGNQLPAEWIAPFADSVPTAHSRQRGRDSLVDLNGFHLPAIRGALDGAVEPSALDGGPDEAEAASASAQFAAGLTRHRSAVGTIFRLHTLTGSHSRCVLLEAVAGHRDSGSSLWLIAGPPSTSAEAIAVDDEAAPTASASTTEVQEMPAEAPKTEEKITIGSLTEETTACAAALYFASQASTSDVLELRRLPSEDVRDVVIVRALLQPLLDYNRDMRQGLLADGFRVREVLKNLTVLRAMLRLSAGDNTMRDAPRAEGNGSRYHFTQRGSASAGLHSAAGHLEPLVDPQWQTKLFDFGVADAVLNLITVTLECPLLPSRLLFSEDVMVNPSTAQATVLAEKSVDDTTAPSVTTPPLPPSPLTRVRHGGSPQRYSDFGKLLDACVQCLSEVMRGRAELSAARQAAADKLMPWCESVPSLLTCLATFYDGNPAFVELPVARPRLDFFLRLLTKCGPDAGVLAILRLFAVCGVESMIEAQEVMVDFFLKNPPVRAEALCTIKLLAPAELSTGSTAFDGRAQAVSDTRADDSVPPSSAFASPLDITTVSAAWLSAFAQPYERDGTRRIAAVALHNRTLAARGSETSSLLSRATPSTSTGAHGTHAATLFGALLQRAASALDADGLTYFPLVGLREVRTGWPEVSNTLLPSLVAQLRLLAALAGGRHARACKLLLPLCVPVTVLQPAALGELPLPSALQAAFVELFTHVSVDCAGAFALEVDLTRIRCVAVDEDDDEPREVKARRGGSQALKNDSITKSQPTTALSHTTPYESPSVSAEQATAKRYVLAYLRDEEGTRTPSSGRTSVHRAVMELLAALVRCGGFAVSEYGALAGVLAHTLDASPQAATTSDSAAHQSPEGPAHATRLCALALLHTLVDVLTAAHALTTVAALRRRKSPPTLTQLLCFPDSTAASASERAPLAHTGYVLDVLQRLAADTTHLTERHRAMALFTRLTTFSAEVARTVRSVQTLTSQQGVDLYRDLDQLATRLQRMASRPLTRANTLAQAHQLVEQLEALQTRHTLAQEGLLSGEWLSMVHHVQLADVLVQLLLALPVPLKGSARELSTRMLTLLQSWTAHELLADALRGAAQRLAPLASHDRAVLALLRALYLPRADSAAQASALLVPPLVVDQVVRCFRQPYLLDEAVHFLIDLLAHATTLPGSQTFLQKAVWQALVDDPAASSMIDFSETWCDLQNGARYREQMLSNVATESAAAPSLPSMGSDPVAVHLGLCHLLYLIARGNDLVHPEEIRHEVFGRSSIDMLLSVLTDGLLPAEFRLPYLRFMVVLLLDDREAAPEVLAHPHFTAYLRTCTLDLYLYMRLCGATLPTSELEEELERRESLVLPWTVPSALCHHVGSDTATRPEPERRDETPGDPLCGVYKAIVFGPLCASLMRICGEYGDSLGTMSMRVQSQVKLAVNECLDALADLGWSLCGSDTTSSSPPPPVRASSMWSVTEYHLVLDVWQTAVRCHFRGTVRWCGEPLEQLVSALNRACAACTAAARTTDDAVPEAQRESCPSVPSEASLCVCTTPALALGRASDEVDRGGSPRSAWSPLSSTTEVMLEGIPALRAGSSTACGTPSATGLSPPLKPLASATVTTATGTVADLSTSQSAAVRKPPSSRRPAPQASPARAALANAPAAAEWEARVRLWADAFEQATASCTHVSAAGVVLRSGAVGTRFLHALFHALPGLSTELVVGTLQLVQEVVTLEPSHADDEAGNPALWAYREDNTAVPESEADGAPVESLALSMPRRRRQVILAHWVGEAGVEIPIPVVALVTEFIGASSVVLRQAALSTATALLAGGHRGMQQSYFDYASRSSQEVLFYVVRNRLSQCVDELRRYRSALEHGSTPTAAAYLLTSLTETSQSLLLIQLLCMGQFTPMQTLLAAQPRNTVSVNLLEPMVELLSFVSSVGNDVTAPFFVQLLATVAETMLGPCVENQERLMAQGVSNQLTDIIHAPLCVTNLSEASSSSFAVDCPDALVASFSTAAADETKTGKEGRRRNVLSAAQWEALQGSALSTLLALIEGRREPSFMRGVVASMDLTVLVSRMDESAALYRRLHGRISRRRPTHTNIRGSLAAVRQVLRDYYHSDFPTDEEELGDELAVAVKIFEFLRACYDVQNLETLATTRRGEGKARLLFDAVSNEFKDKRGCTIAHVARSSKSFSELANKVGAVEIVRDGSLERVYFRILASSQESLYRRTRNRLIDDAVRTSDNERIQFFFQRSLEVLLELNLYRRLRRRVVLYAVHCCSQEVNMFSLLLILAINLTMLFTITASTSPYRSEDTSRQAWLALRALGVVNIITESVMLIQSFIGPAWANLLMGWERWRNAQFERAAAQTLKRVAEQFQDDAADVTRKESEKYAANAAVAERDATTARLSMAEKVARSAGYLFGTGMFLQHLVFLFFCIMGFVHSPIWYAAQLFQVLLNSTVLQFMFRSLSVRAMSLFLTFCTLFFAVYFFSTITYYNYAQLIDPINSGSNNGFNCYSLKNCWMVHVDTLRKGGGIGDSAQWPTFYSKDQSAYGFFAFRIVYYIVLSLVLNNLFLGVIIDGLAESRARRLTISTDQTQKCFICGQERNVFDVVQPGAYDTHITEEHNMWQYIYFLHYLSKKDPSTFTGQEAYVHNLVQLRDVTFFPIGKSLTLATVNKASGADGAETAQPPPKEETALTERQIQTAVAAALAEHLGELGPLLQAVLADRRAAH